LGHEPAQSVENAVEAGGFIDFDVDPGRIQGNVRIGRLQTGDDADLRHHRNDRPLRAHRVSIISAMAAVCSRE